MSISKYLTPSPLKNSIDVDGFLPSGSSTNEQPMSCRTNDAKIELSSTPPSYHAESNETGGPAWPGRSSMKDIGKSLSEALKDDATNKSAWKSVYDEHGFKYVKSTVSWYRRWLEAIDDNQQNLTSL
ncbi:uncharacterized protein MELLADRAFT_66855 [Melampsora larici-populina 98AG31]|uniref:Uncharacterized protein n=1 Tax=Melampsora larici-populina (strain 98AG31 / pathotype 3-4-7) TaxID=747676 RepID=F4S0V8_MELLP|nr:uncharacterized protein MELLADRAFT_66855 [Melampsora larici-populina 98AG31]EGG01658.1 hypothetical protein MELLADRAFT_66855 [Melampsora larici-populina 98AG31]